jgi:2-polyprenyl-3-methyl-5-hydroxy-6-metoxy-1,4-benzoquinol methylase
MQISTRCAICNSFENSEVIYKSTVDSNSFTPEIFSARRLPDRKYYQWVRCKKCSLYRSDPVSDIDLSELYKKSSFDYSNELHGLSNSYKKIVSKTCQNPSGKTLIEIGGGNGFFLEEALDMGFNSVVEVEPSINAYNSAKPNLKQYFIVEMLKTGLIEYDIADIVVIFHVLDHLTDPAEVLRLIYKMLKPGGSICIAVHNINSVSAKVLGSKSPIFDVEHTYLYSQKTIKRMLTDAGFKRVKASHYKNSYSILYLIHLIPIGSGLKKKMLESKIMRKFSNIRLTVPLGNMWASGVKD